MTFLITYAITVKAMKTVILSKVNRGELFKLTNTATAPLYVKGRFKVAEAGYECCKYDDQAVRKVYPAKRQVFKVNRNWRK